MTDFASTGPITNDLCYRGDNGYIGIAEGTFATKPLGFAVINYTYVTNSQSLTAVLGDQGRALEPRTYLYTHSTTTHTAGAYCAFNRYVVEIGTYTRSGGVYTYTPAGPATSFSGKVAINPGQRVEFHNVDAVWDVLVDDIPVDLPTFDMSAVPFDPSHRSAMISMERKQITVAEGFLAPGDYESFRIASLVMADMVQPEFVGSGAKMKAVGSGTINWSSSGTIPSHFNSVEGTDDITTNVSLSKFTVLIKGHYKIVLRTKNAIPSGPTLAGQILTHQLFLNGALYEAGSDLINSYTGSTVTWKSGLQSTWTIYLSPGDYVQAGLSSTAVITNALVQDSDGTENIFSIALLTRNLL